jgi:transcriptional regulator with XRE-family HTH domain
MVKPLAVRVGLRDIGENLRHWRKLLKLSQKDLAVRADVSVPTVQRLESGAGASLENLLKVTQALGPLTDVVEATNPWTNSRGQPLASAELEGRSRR